MQIGVKLVLLVLATISLVSGAQVEDDNSHHANPDGPVGTKKPKGHEPKVSHDPKGSHEPKGTTADGNTAPQKPLITTPTGSPPEIANNPCKNSKDITCDPKYSKADLLKRSSCFRYFYAKDHCVTASLETPRCKPGTPKVASHAGVVQHPHHHKHGQQKVMSHSKRTLERRYTTNLQSDWVAGGNGVCGYYDTNVTEGVCIWSGAGTNLGNEKPNTGWLNGGSTFNCGKKVYITRDDPMDPTKQITVFAPILDACGLNAKQDSVGCFEMFLTNKTFNALKPTPQEIKQGHLTKLHWGFDNEEGTHPAMASS